MPSKTLIYSAEVLHQAKQGSMFGFDSIDLKADMSCHGRKKKGDNRRICRLSKGSVGRWAIYSFRSKAKFWMKIASSLKMVPLLKADKYVISTGSKISMPEVPGLNEVSFKTSDDVLDLSEIPEEVVVLGGGYCSL